MSPHMRGKGLSRTVTSWLLDGKCLAELVPFKSQTGADGNASTSDGLSWATESGQEYACRWEHCKVGVVYVARAGNTGDWLPLRYMEETQTWKTSGDPTVPGKVLAQMSNYVKRLSRDDA